MGVCRSGGKIVLRGAGDVRELRAGGGCYFCDVPDNSIRRARSTVQILCGVAAEKPRFFIASTLFWQYFRTTISVCKREIKHCDHFSAGRTDLHPSAGTNFVPGTVVDSDGVIAVCQNHRYSSRRPRHSLSDTTGLRRVFCHASGFADNYSGSSRLTVGMNRSTRTARLLRGKGSNYISRYRSDGVLGRTSLW